MDLQEQMMHSVSARKQELEYKFTIIQHELLELQRQSKSVEKELNILKELLNMHADEYQKIMMTDVDVEAEPTVHSDDNVSGTESYGTKGPGMPTRNEIGNGENQELLEEGVVSDLSANESLREASLMFARVNDLSFEDSLEEILATENSAMHVDRIAEKLLERGVVIPGRGDHANIITRLRRAPEKFDWIGAGTYALTKWDLPKKKNIKSRKRIRNMRAHGR